MNTLIPNNANLKEGEMFSFYFGADKIRGIVRNSKPWILAKDICDAIEIANSRDALKSIPEDELVSLKATSGGQSREMNFLSEPGMYRLLFRSNKPKAEPFVRWVTHEVLPSIRKQGFYKLERQVSEYKDKALTAYEWYHQASLECKTLKERYRKSHSKLSAYEIAQIQNMARQDKSTSQIAMQVGRSNTTSPQIQKTNGGGGVNEQCTEDQVCRELNSVLEPGHSNGKGFHPHYGANYDLEVVFIGVSYHSKAKLKGPLIKFCPFCGGSPGKVVTNFKKQMEVGA